MRYVTSRDDTNDVYILGIIRRRAVIIMYHPHWGDIRRRRRHPPPSPLPPQPPPIFRASIFIVLPPLPPHKKKCWQPCITDADCCSLAQTCLDVGSACGTSSDLGGTVHNYCGSTWCGASYACGRPCPGGTDGECDPGDYCFADTPCGGESPATTIIPPILPPPPASSAFRFCGASASDASADCWQPCPRGDAECCHGLRCFDTSSSSSGGGEEGYTGGTCPSSDYSGPSHYYCGSSWCDAAYACSAGCPGGADAECPPGARCYADVPCDGGGGAPPSLPADDAAAAAAVDDDDGGGFPPTTASSFSRYCGSSPGDAAELCWQPCRDDGDCCAGQACHANVTSCGYPENVGADHFFCGSGELLFAVAPVFVIFLPRGGGGGGGGISNIGAQLLPISQHGRANYIFDRISSFPSFRRLLQCSVRMRHAVPERTRRVLSRRAKVLPQHAL